jgi:CPA1 family monovalent cation:H+ antiporter
MELNTALLVLIALLIVASLTQRLAVQTTLPASILLAVAGVMIGGAAMLAEHVRWGGPIAEAVKAFADLPIESEVFLYIFLPVLLFQSALTIDVRPIVEDAAPILLLAVIAVVVATGVIGLSLAPLAGVPLVACLMLGAIVATTDPVAVIAIFRDIGAPARLTRLVGGESLLNDAAAITVFAVLFGMLQGTGTGSVVPTALAFLWTFVGGIVAGFLGARLAVLLLAWLRELKFAQVTLTLGLPYVVFIASEQALGVSGVVAAVTAGLVCSAIGEGRVAPADWRFLNDVWEQLAFWASCLVFLLAALLAPELLAGASWHDAVLLAVLVAAALAARALVLYGLLPAFSWLGLGQRIDHRYQAVILWGGLRGAVTLALALAVQEDPDVDDEVQRFIGVLATGFVLFTLLVNGLTLRWVIRMVGLDRLSPFDEALRTQVVSLSRRRVAEAVERIGHQYGVPADLTATVAGDYRTPGAGRTTGRAVTTAGDEDQRRLGLMGLASHERALVLEHFAARSVLGRVVGELLVDADRLIDGTRTGGRDGYLAAAGEQLAFSRSFRVAHMLHWRCRIDGPLIDRLGDRFERLLVCRVILDDLHPYVTTSLVPLVGDRIAPELRRVLDQRRRMVDAALEALRAQYPGFAQQLEDRFLRRLALRREEVEYRTLSRERLIGPELYMTLQRELRTAWQRAEIRPRLDLGLETRTLLGKVPVFAGLDAQQIDRVARLLRPRIAMPDERLITEGERGDRLYFISSGVVEAVAEGQRVRLTRGDFFGEMALVLHVPRQADVTAVSYCQLLVLERRDLRTLFRRHPAIKQQIDRVALARARMNEAAARRSSPSRAPARDDAHDG